MRIYNVKIKIAPIQTGLYNVEIKIAPIPQGFCRNVVKRQWSGAKVRGKGSLGCEESASVREEEDDAGLGGRRRRAGRKNFRVVVGSSLLLD